MPIIDKTDIVDDLERMVVRALAKGTRDDIILAGAIHDGIREIRRLRVACGVMGGRISGLRGALRAEVNGTPLHPGFVEELLSEDDD